MHLKAYKGAPTTELGTCCTCIFCMIKKKKKKKTFQMMDIITFQPDSNFAAKHCLNREAAECPDWLP